MCSSTRRGGTTRRVRRGRSARRVSRCARASTRANAPCARAFRHRARKGAKRAARPLSEQARAAVPACICALLVNRPATLPFSVFRPTRRGTAMPSLRGAKRCVFSRDPPLPAICSKWRGPARRGGIRSATPTRTHIICMVWTSASAPCADLSATDLASQRFIRHEDMRSAQLFDQVPIRGVSSVC